MYQFLVRLHSLYENITVYVGAITISKEFWKGIAAFRVQNNIYGHITDSMCAIRFNWGHGSYNCFL